MKILFKYATRSRPELFKRGIESILNNVSNQYWEKKILVSVDLDDPTAIDAVRPYYDNDEIVIVFGNSKNKIDAINRDIELIKDWDILVNMSDDMVFNKKGFDEIINEQFINRNETPPINLDLCIHFPDQNQGANCMTMTIVGRDYYLRDNFIYEPECESLWADIIAQEKAQIRGCYKYVNENIYLHLHPSFGQAQYDSQYQRTESMEVRQRDYATYLKLKAEYDPTNILPIRSI